MKRSIETIIELDVTIAFEKVKKDSPFYDKSISWWTKSGYIHTEIIIGDKWISSLDTGVHVKLLRPLKDQYTYKKLPTIKLRRQQYNDIMEWIYKQEGKSYDYTGIMYSQVLPLRLDNRNEWFCSEIVTKILQLLLVKEVFNLLPHLQSPGDLARLFDVPDIPYANFIDIFRR